MIKIPYIIVLSCFTTLTYAQTNFDHLLLKDKIIDPNFNIINSKEFDKLMRDTTNNISSLMPMKTDAYTTLLSMNISKFGIYANYQLDDVENTTDAEMVMYKFKMGQDYKNYLCSSEIAQSQTFKKLNAIANVNLLNSKYEVIFNMKIPLRQC